MKTKRIIVANWKMNPKTLSEARSLFQSTSRTAGRLAKVETVVCPPFVFTGALISSKTKCSLGAQDVFWHKEGAFTGEISPAELRSVGVSYVILGHSERRSLGETNEMVAAKLKAAFEYRLNVVLCVGERERDSRGHYLSFLKDEIKKSIGKARKEDVWRRLIVAYEPLWAIGAEAKRADTPEALFEISLFIRKVLSDSFGRGAAFSVPILYGGSVTEVNAEAFLERGGIAGLLVGRASLDPRQFSEILRIAQRV